MKPLLAALASAALVGAIVAVPLFGLWAPNPIRIGVLHSLTGTMAMSETSLVDAVQFGVAELNARGGVLGRPVEAVVADGASSPEVFAAEAERLIATERVAALFGCWTSGSRRTVRPVIERHDHLLFYPLQYEGLEQSPNIVYTGAAPNQQIIPALKWALGNLGRRFFLVGSDYVFPRAAHAIIRDHLRQWRGEIVGEAYILLGSHDVEGTVAEIVRARPAVILNTLNGDTNLSFFRALRAGGVTPDRVPTLSFSIAEPELQSLTPALMAGDYAAWNYFQSIDTPVNERFVRAFRDRYGADRVVSDPIEASYVGVRLWAGAVEAAGTPDPGPVRRAVVERSLRGPGGMVYVDGESRHTWKIVRIGRIRPDGQFDIVWASDHPIRPVPYPPQRPPDAWETFLRELYDGWGGRWVNPQAGDGFSRQPPPAPRLPGTVSPSGG